MLSKKITGFMLIVIIMLCIIPATTVTASTGFELGDFTIISENNQQNGWCTNGVDGIETKIYIRAFERVINLFFEFDSNVDNITLVCMGDGNGWTWTETPVEVNGNWFSVDVGDINGWAEIMTGNDIKILLCNYNPNWDNIKVKGFTSMPGGTFANEEPWMPKDFKIGSGKTIIPAVDFDPDNFYDVKRVDRYIIRTEMANINGPQTEGGFSGFGDNICCIEASEWVQYTVEVTEAGKYNFSAWLANDYSGNSGNIEIYIDDVFAGESDDSTTEWVYELYPVESIDLTVGTHVIKTVFPKGGLLFSALEIVSENIPEPVSEETPNIIEQSPKTGDTWLICIAGIFIVMCVMKKSYNIKSRSYL